VLMETGSAHIATENRRSWRQRISYTQSTVLRFSQRKDVESRAKRLYTVLMGCCVRSARYQTPQKNGPYSTPIILATLSLPKMSVAQSSHFIEHIVNHQNSFMWCSFYRKIAHLFV